jgi:RNA polymerase sigma-70 factor (ECF subfamily)
MTTESTSRSAGSVGRFEATRWTVILTAGDPASPDHEQARNQFCQAYWCPVYAFVRRKGHSPEAAEDLTQDFFAWFLSQEVLARLTREGGRFRSYLLKVLQHFLSNAWKREQALKRGGSKTMLSLDDSAESRYQAHLAEDRTPEALFDRQWAIAAVDQALTRLGEEYCRDGKQRIFEKLQGCLPSSSETLCYAEAAQTLGLKEEAVRMAAHRLRRRYGELLREEVATPGTRPKEIDDEIRHLIAVMGGP